MLGLSVYCFCVVITFIVHSLCYYYNAKIAPHDRMPSEMFWAGVFIPPIGWVCWVIYLWIFASYWLDNCTLGNYLDWLKKKAGE